MTTRIARAIDRLESAFGKPVRSGLCDPLESLVGAILSQNTSDLNSDRAFSALTRRFPDWNDLLKASQEDIAQVIKIAGLSNQRSKRIITLLQWAKERFKGFDCSEICTWNIEQAEKELRILPGIGIKTIAVTLLFACGHDLCPVDTHVFRTISRLGWLGEPKSRDGMFWMLQGKFPPGGGYSLHLNLIRLGRQICKPRNPQCPQCPLSYDCNYLATENR